MKRLLKFLMMLTALSVVCSNAFAQGGSRADAIQVNFGETYNLSGRKDFNTTTWFYVDSLDFIENNLLTVALSGGNFGDVAFFGADNPEVDELFFITGENGKGTNPTFKKFWNAADGGLLIAVTQDNSGGKVCFSLSKAIDGETRQNAIEAVAGNNRAESQLRTVWYSFKALEEKEYFITSDSRIGNAVDSSGHIVCVDVLLSSGFRMEAGMTVYFPVTVIETAMFSISSRDLQAGYYSDFPLDITGLSQFVIDLPADPNATTNSSAQSERYWSYTADKTGFLMWGTSDAAWIEGSWGCTVRDMTEERNLNTPKTEKVAGMLTYTVPVMAGHTYMIFQSVAYAKARKVTVYAIYKEPRQGDTRDNPLILELGKQLNIGRKSENTRYYSFTASEAGVYTATIHAGGQVRATTPQDGSWNISRDYSITGMQMHIDDAITLDAGESLELEITLTSDIDIHVDGSDSSIPDYSILITRNDDSGQTVPEVREGEDLQHAIELQQNEKVALQQNNDEDYYVHYYKIAVPANDTLVIVTDHSPAVSSPDCIAVYDMNGTVMHCSTDFVVTEGSDRRTGRIYRLGPSDSDRTLFIATYGVSFLYDGALWSYYLLSEGVVSSVDSQDTLDMGSYEYYLLDGTRTENIDAPGVYLARDLNKNVVKKIIIR